MIRSKPSLILLIPAAVQSTFVCVCFCAFHCVDESIRSVLSLPSCYLCSGFLPPSFFLSLSLSGSSELASLEKCLAGISGPQPIPCIAIAIAIAKPSLEQHQQQHQQLVSSLASFSLSRHSLSPFSLTVSLFSAPFSAKALLVALVAT